MHSLTFVLFFLATFIIEISFSQSNCDSRSDIGKIGDTQSLRRAEKVEKCWIVMVPAQKYAKIELTKLSIDRTVYTNVYIKIGDHTIFPPLQNKFEHVGEEDTTVTFYAENTRNANEVTAEFELNYKVESLACEQSDAFRCSETECVPWSKRCDGVRDCANGADERNCGVVEPGNDPLKEIRDKAVKNLMDMMYVTGGWGPNTPDAVIALHLATGTDFRDKLEDKLIAKDLELYICKNSDETQSEFPKAVPKFINALLAIGVDSTMPTTADLITKMKNLKSDPNMDKALYYLALCNTKEEDLIGDIDTIMQPFKTSDIVQQYYAAMTINCMNRRQYDQQNQREQMENAIKQMKTAIRALKARQRNDGSFSGNVKDTAMILQAIMASYTTEDKGYDYTKAFDYLKSEISKSSIKFDELVLTLPVLRNKTLADIGNEEKSRKGAVLRDNEARKGIYLRFGDKNFFPKIVEAKENKKVSPLFQVAPVHNSKFRTRSVIAERKEGVSSVV